MPAYAYKTTTGFKFQKGFFLRLIFHGIPALAVLGTNNWTKETSGLLVAKGAQHVIACGDGDPAGRAFNEKLYVDLLDNFTSHIFPCEDDQDPGSMEEPLLNLLKKIVNKYR